MMLLHKQGAPALLLPEFLREIFLGRRTGLLHVTYDEATSVSFRAVSGELVSGSSSDTRGRLGETMVRRGLLSRSDLDRAIVSGSAGSHRSCASSSSWTLTGWSRRWYSMSRSCS